MTLLSICTLAAQAIGVDVPQTIIGNSTDTAQQLLAAAQDEGEALARRPQGGWTQMMREHVFQTVAISNTTGNVTANSAVITNIQPNTTGIAGGTFYVSGNGLLNNSIVGSVDSSSQVTIQSPYTATASFTNTALVFSQSDYALPSDFERLIDNTLWDRTRYWQMRGPQSPQQWQMFKSSVIGRATIQRRWRIRNINGNEVFSIDPIPTDNGSYLVFEYVSNAWCKSNAVPPVYQTQWMADTDTGVIDEYLIRLGVKWRMLERLGLNYAAAREEYERECDKAVAQDGGSGVLSITPWANPYLITPWQVPDTGYGAPYP